MQKNLAMLVFLAAIAVSVTSTSFRSKEQKKVLHDYADSIREECKTSHGEIFKYIGCTICMH